MSCLLNPLFVAVESDASALDTFAKSNWRWVAVVFLLFALLGVFYSIANRHWIRSALCYAVALYATVATAHALVYPRTGARIVEAALIALFFPVFYFAARVPRSDPEEPEKMLPGFSTKGALIVAGIFFLVGELWEAFVRVGD